MTRDARPGFIELVEEQLEIGKREVERGRVVVRTRVEERDEVAEIELQQEDVSVERVPRGVPVEALPAVREEDGVLIIPVVEEQLVVTTRLILKEEIRITRQSRTELVREPVRLRSERADIERLEGRSPVSLSSRKGVPSMTDRTLTAMYDTRGAAETARDQLVGIGVAARGHFDPRHGRRARHGRCRGKPGLLGQPRRSVHAGRGSSHLHRGAQARWLSPQRARARRNRGHRSRRPRKLRSDRSGSA